MKRHSSKFWKTARMTDFNITAIVMNLVILLLGYYKGKFVERRHADRCFDTATKRYVRYLRKEVRILKKERRSLIFNELDERIAAAVQACSNTSQLNPSGDDQPISGNDDAGASDADSPEWDVTYK